MTSPVSKLASSYAIYKILLLIFSVHYMFRIWGGKAGSLLSGWLVMIYQWPLCGRVSMPPVLWVEFMILQKAV